MFLADFGIDIWYKNVTINSYSFNIMNVFFSIAEPGMPDIQPMVIAIWCGLQKPSNLNEFLDPFVKELNEILLNGNVINGHHVTVTFHCCVCDTPARAFIKGKYEFPMF